MSPASNFWSPTTKLTFHQKVVELYDHNRDPCAAKAYRQHDSQESGAYVLLSGEEQHIADHFAFLAQSEEGARMVSAATVEENGRTGLTIRLAGNQTPSEDVLRGLREIGQIVELYATEGKSREQCCENLFDRVIIFSRKRIHERLRSKRSPRPWWTRNQASKPSYAPLHSRLREKLQILRRSSRSRAQGSGAYCDELEALAKCYEDVDGTDNKDEQHELLKRAVRRSFSVSTLGATRSVEEHLKSLNFGQQVYQSREVLEIDKIARYLALCKDLIHLGRRHRPLFSNIRIERLEAPPEIQPEGAIKICHVHGEVQLVLYYERHPHNPPPRAIGSSKSACFLCDLFLEKHSQYSISHSHKHLYHQWTIPDVDWMTEQQADRFGRIIQAMIKELTRLRRTCKKQKPGNFNGFESRAHLLLPQPLSATSTPSILSQIAEAQGGPLTPPITPRELPQAVDVTRSLSATRSAPGLKGSVSDDNTTVNSSSNISSLYLTHQDIPFSQSISLTTPSMYLAVDEFSLSLDFLEVRSGRMSITQMDMASVSETDCGYIGLADIPTTSEMQVDCLDDSDELIVCLRSSQKGAMRFQFIWGNGQFN